MYQGDWTAGKKHGRGIMRCANGIEYDGEFANNSFRGCGILRLTKWYGLKS